MDTSASIDAIATMDVMDTDNMLPELSFDDLLELSPKKHPGSDSDDNDPLDLDQDPENSDDKLLNTPSGPKKLPPSQHSTQDKTQEHSILVSSKLQKMPTVTTHKVCDNNKPVPAILTSSTTPTTATTMTSASATTSSVVLNTKNVLPKTSTSFVQIAPKTPATTTAATNAVSTGSSTDAAPSPGEIKTTLKIPNGQQIVYLQKAAGLPAVRYQAKTPGTNTVISATGTASSTTTGTIITALPSSNVTSTAVTTLTNIASSSAVSKTVSIQVIRAPDGSLVPVKPSTVASKGTLPLSPVTATKIITSTGTHVVLKSLKSVSATTTLGNTAGSGSNNTAVITAATNAESPKTVKITKISPATVGVATTALPTTSTVTTASNISNATSSAGKFVVQSTTGQKIMVSKQSLIKLSPKPTVITTVASTANASQLHAIQIPGKPGLQYVRMVPGAKLTHASIVASANKVGTAHGTAVTTTTSAVTSTTTAPSTIKILHNTPQKFTVLRPCGPTKIALTQSPKTEGTEVTFSPVTSKVQKTLLTPVPPLRPIGTDVKPQQSLIKGAISTVSVISKTKISEINTEIQRITTAPYSEGSGTGATRDDPKKLATGSRIVLMPRSALQSAVPRTLPTVSAASGISTGQHRISNNTAQAKKLFSVLKSRNPGRTNAEVKSLIICGQAQARTLPTVSVASGVSTGQHRISNTAQAKKLFSVLKSRNPGRTNAEVKSLIICGQAQALMAQQKKTTTSNDAGHRHPNQKVYMPVAKGKQDGATASGAGTYLDESSVQLRRKHCNCSKSQCLKLYCDCFANGEFCQDCTCKDCFNNLQYEDERQRAIKNCLERNPSAFKPKITSARDQGDMRQHNKGCNCKRSYCLKNYCECYEAKIPCSNNCKCVGCRNVEDRPEMEFDPVDLNNVKLEHSDAAEQELPSTGGTKRTYEKVQKDNSKELIEVNKRVKSEIFDSHSNSSDGGQVGSAAIKEEPKQPQYNFITPEVIDATIQCMVSQADECEKSGLPIHQTERMVMEELGRCLVEIIDFSIRSVDGSFSQD